MQVKYCPVCKDEKLLDGISFECPGCHNPWGSVWRESKKILRETLGERQRANRKRKREHKARMAAINAEKEAAKKAEREANKQVIKALRATQISTEKDIAERRALEHKRLYGFDPRNPQERRPEEPRKTRAYRRESPC